MGFSWPRSLAPLFALAAASAIMPHASAQPAAATRDAVDAASRGRHDYSRFSNGPRRVPTGRGASLARAQELGLGSRDTANRLLHARPRRAWVRAARGEVGRHLTWPVETGRFGRGFGFVRRTRPDHRHDGVDIVAAEGSTVRAAADGIVGYSDNGIRGYGNCVLIIHPNGWVTLYAHLYRATVPAGYRVRAGERIGFVGNTGISRGPHLHFELHVEGHARDPLPKFQGRPWVAAYRTWQRRLAAGTYRAPTEHRTLPGSSRVPSGDSRADRRARERSADPDPPASARASAAEPGTEAHAQALMTAAVPASMLESIEGRLFRNVLWPLRGESRVRRRFTRSRRGVELAGESGAAVRAAADGLIAFVGNLPGLGRSIVLVHKNGWVSVYGGLGATHVEPGQPIERGEWIGALRRGSRARLRYRLYVGGEVSNPTEHFAGAPS